MRTICQRVIAALSGVVVVAVAPTAAYAAPANDDFAAATAIATLPYTTSQDTSDATSDPGDPTDCSSNGSVWFSYTATSVGLIEANTFGSGYDTVLSAWTGAPDSLSMWACNDDTSGLQSQIRLSPTPGTTYYFMVAVCCGSGGSGGGSLQFAVSQSQPAGNDSFGNATSVTALPFTDEQDLTTAGTEPGEPTGCFTASSTVWYSYTPATTQSVMASTQEYFGAVAAYTGSDISALSQVSCSRQADYQPVVFTAQAGTTYHFQVGAVSGTGIVHFRLEATPAPSASFGYYPGDPSAFDTVEFYDRSWDPARVDIVSQAWDFGDGTTGTGPYPTHRYGKDGDYTVTLTVTTRDGRTGSTSMVIPVRTHDVSIVRLTAPGTARVGQTIGINVYVKNTRYTEDVQVTLLRSTSTGFALVGSSTQQVVATTTGQTTRFSFNYTVTGDDLAAGKVTFKATATLLGHRDALPADNELISTPVRVG